jgi:tetratricopeptide (TPR) repeat protein
MGSRGRLAIALVAVLVPAAASAQEAPEARAKALYLQGGTEYKLGQFDKALVHFEAALKLVTRPNIILNIAQCHRQLKHPKKAIFYYRYYLTEWKRQHPEAAGPPPYNTEVNQYIDELNAELERARQAESAARRERQRQQELEAREREKARAKEQAKQAQPRTDLVVVTPEPEKPPGPPPIYKRWWFWTVVGVAVAGAVTATAVALQPDDIEPVTGTMTPGQLQFKLGCPGCAGR